ncbi:MAG: GatB/YqeY domain-containing protein [Gammaproteobacteria bacterium]|nr:GatB/YqeY domain-containing protein [Gammaproteobacteria bacterium]
MTQSLKQRIDDEIKVAMRAKDKTRLGTLRLVSAAIKQREVDERITLDDIQVLAVLDKMIKQRRDSIEQYRKAAREELAQREEVEIQVIQAFMPAALSEAELDALVAEAVTESGAASIKDMGKVMALLRPKVQGRADMGVVSAKLKARLPA